MRRPGPLVLLVLLLALAACTPRPEPTPMPPEAPPAEPADGVTEPPVPEPAPEPRPEPERMPPEREPEPEPQPELLYVKTADELRQAFADALFSLYRVEADLADARQLDRDEVRAWLADLDAINPAAVDAARQAVGDVLRYQYAVGFVLPVRTASCARLDEVLYIAVPERLQTPERAFDGFIVRDVCDEGTPESWCRQCTGAVGEAADGTPCSCVCTTAACPAVRCVKC